MSRRLTLLLGCAVGALALNGAGGADIGAPRVSAASSARLWLTVAGVEAFVTSEPEGRIIRCFSELSRCLIEYKSGSSITLTAGTTGSAIFDRWIGGCPNRGPVCNLTLDAGDSNLTAAYTRVRLLTTEIRSGVSADPAGTECGGGCREYPFGVAVKLTVSDTSARFLGWTGSCEAYKRQPTCKVRMVANRTFGAEFDPPSELPSYDPVPVKVKVSGLGSVKGTVSCTPPDCPKKKRIQQGKNASFRAVPFAGKKFLGWTGACQGKGQCFFTVLWRSGKGPTVGAMFEK